MNTQTKIQHIGIDGSPYGRVEIKKSLQKNLAKGLAISVIIHMIIVGGYYAGIVLGEDDDAAPVVRMRVMKYSDLGPPPSISNIPPPPSVAITAAAKPSIGTPVPVPDAEVSPEQTIATQQELSTAPTPSLEQLGENGQVEISQDIMIDDEPGMNEFIPVEKAPQVVKRVMPRYPDMAMRAGIEGKVWVKILVDKEGKPKKAVIIKSSAEIFNDSAIEAAMQFIFTPAVMNNGPVKVWVSIPFTFVLKDAQPS